MDNNQFRALVKKAAEGKANAQELKQLEQFVAYKQQVNPLDLAKTSVFSQQKILDQTLQQIAVKKKKKHQAVLKYAAVLVFALLSAASFTYLTFIEESSIDYTSHVTVGGERKEVIMPDGTVVILKGDSSLRFATDYNQQTRTVYLKGTAFFDVESNKQKPFIVQTEAFHTTVLGTSFNIVAKEDVAEVTVVTGKVKVTDENQQPVYLTPNKQFSFDFTTQTASVNTIDANYYKLWSQGVIAFQETPIDDVVTMLNRWFDVSIVYQGKHSETLTATYDNETLAYILQDIAFMLDVTVKQQNQTTYIFQ